MRKRALSVLAVAVAVGLVSTVLFAPAASARPRVHEARLNGEKEIGTEGDANGRGTAVITTQWKKRRVCFALGWRRLGPVVAAHIHVGGRRVAGDVVVPLYTGAELPRYVNALGGCIKNVDRKLIGRINRNPQGYYVNIHTRGYPDGAIRGQLRLA
jgi:CHRD domain-containing protein